MEKPLIHRCVFPLAFAVAAVAQEAPPSAIDQATATVPAGVPLRVAIERRVAIKRVGEPIQGRLVDPIYVFDRLAIPAGSVVEGRVSKIGGVPASRRVKATLSGNLTPPKEVRAQFDTLVLSNGSRLPLSTTPSRGTAHTQRIAAQGTRQPQGETTPAAIRAFAVPGKMSRLKSYMFGMFPYHRQAWAAGTLFNGVLREPLAGLRASSDAVQLGQPPVGRLEGQEVDARLLTPLSSSTAISGAPVEAVATRPVFSADHELLIPEGTRFIGEVVKAQPARYLHRNGKLLFAFHQIQLASSDAQSIQGYVEGVEADLDAHLVLDAEGAARVTSPKTRFIFPAIAVAVAGLSFHQDYNAQGVPDADSAGRAESGAVGLGLIGTALAQASRTLASSIAITGAGYSIYSTFLVRGQDVVLPANTPIKISLRARAR